MVDVVKRKQRFNRVWVDVREWEEIESSGTGKGKEVSATQREKEQESGNRRGKRMSRSMGRT